MWKNLSNIQTSKYTRTIGIIVLIVVAIFFDLFIAGFVKYSYSVARCGKFPIAATPSAQSGSPWTYRLPGHYTPGWASTVYICTESEAKSAGYVKSLYE